MFALGVCADALNRSSHAEMGVDWSSVDRERGPEKTNES